MAYNERLAERIREVFAGHRNVVEKKMFGGLAFMVKGHMCVGVTAEDLMVRVGPAAYEDALKRPHTRVMDFTGRALKGMVYVSPEGYRTKPGLRRWINDALTFVETLPPKAGKK